MSELGAEFCATKDEAPVPALSPHLRCQTKQGLTQGIKEQSRCSVGPMVYHRVNVSVNGNELDSSVCGWRVEHFRKSRKGIVIKSFLKETT